MINEKHLLQLVNELYLSPEIKLSDIPDVDLYMAQVQSYLTHKLGDSKRNEKDKILTNTMINNYIKDNLLMKPTKRKQYSKQHMILMILLYHLKQILSLDDIKKVFKLFLKDMSSIEDNTLEDVYSSFIELKKKEFDNFKNILSRNLISINEKTKKVHSTNQEEQAIEEWFLLVIMLATQAHFQKRLAEKIIDSHL